MERIYGIRHGAQEFQGNQYSEVSSNNFKSPQKTQEQLASDMGITVQTLQNYKLIAEMIPELEDLMDTGIVTKVRQSSQPHSYSAYRYCGKKTCLL